MNLMGLNEINKNTVLIFLVDQQPFIVEPLLQLNSGQRRVVELVFRRIQKRILVILFFLWQLFADKVYGHYPNQQADKKDSLFLRRV